MKQIVFTKPNTAELLEVPLREPNENEVVVQTEFSSISSGTERANITGDPNVSIHSKDTDPVVFPRVSGYSSAGIVVKKGANVSSVEIGDKVVMSWSTHAKYNVLPESNVVKISYENVSTRDGALCHIATFPLAAIRKTELEVGESMLVMGLGVLGLFAVQIAKSAGAVPVIAVDPMPERREKALKMGADFAVDPFEPDFVEKVKALTNGGVNTAIEVTGLGVGLNQCLDCMKPFGRIALLGCTRNKDFTVDYYRKVHGPGIKLIGAHTNARPKTESAPHAFTQREDITTLLKLCAFDRISLGDAVDETYSPNDCSDVYERLIKDKSFSPIVQFDWRNI